MHVESGVDFEKGREDGEYMFAEMKLMQTYIQFLTIAPSPCRKAY